MHLFNEQMKGQVIQMNKAKKHPEQHTSHTVSHQHKTEQVKMPTMRTSNQTKYYLTVLTVQT